MRYHQLQALLKDNGIEAALLSYHRDLYFYAGTSQPCNLLVPQEGSPVLFVRRAIDFVRQETCLENLISAAGFEPIYESLLDRFPQGGKLGVALDILPARLYLRMQQYFPKFELVNVSPLILQQRMIKEEAEIKRLKDAAEVFKEAHRAVMENLRPGITEKELALEVYRAVRKGGAEAVNFHRRWDGVSSHEGVLAGSKTAWQISGLAMTVTGKGEGSHLPWGASKERLEKGDQVVLDIGIHAGGYHNDTARTYVVGKADSLLRERYQAVEEIMQNALTKLIPGVPAEEVYFSALEKAKSLQVEHYLQGCGDMQGNYIGHGIGVELDEPPALMEGVKEPLQKNMVVCVEPKLIIPHWGAANVEDTLIVRGNSPESLSSVPRKLYEVF